MFQGVHMNIELRFLQKAIKDRNYISFTYNAKKYKNIKVLSLHSDNDKYIFETSEESFKFENISKIVISKHKF